MGCFEYVLARKLCGGDGGSALSLSNGFMTLVELWMTRSEDLESGSSDVIGPFPLTHFNEPITIPLPDLREVTQLRLSG